MLTRQEMVGPWAGLPVAWDEHMRFDEGTYRANVARTCRAGVPGVYTAGTTGEFYAMELDEWKAVASATVEECREHGTPAMLGVTSTYTRGARLRAAYAAEIGADAVQVALPFWMELDDRQVLPFYEAVADACPGLALSVYETLRAKKALSLDQHRAIHDSTGRYLAVKANANTLGRTADGCRELSEFVNVWVGENEWNHLGPHGAIGCCSSLVYMNPRVLLHMFTLLRQQRWQELQPWTDMVNRLITEGLAPFTAKGYTDTAYDRLMGVTSGFLTMSLRSRPPYIAATDEDARELRQWMETNTPELLQL